MPNKFNKIDDSIFEKKPLLLKEKLSLLAHNPNDKSHDDSTCVLNSRYSHPVYDPINFAADGAGLRRRCGVRTTAAGAAQENKLGNLGLEPKLRANGKNEKITFSHAVYPHLSGMDTHTCTEPSSHDNSDVVGAGSRSTSKSSSSSSSTTGSELALFNKTRFN
jgi:hypothetical protein